MAFYGKHHIILYGIASGNDNNIPKKNFFTKKFLEEKAYENIIHDNKNKIPTYHPLLEIEEDPENELVLPTCLDGHFVNNGQSLLALTNKDSKIFTLHSMSLTGATVEQTMMKEFVTNSYYNAILFSSDQRFCLLMDDVKDQYHLNRKLHISYVIYKTVNSHQKMSISQGQLHKNAYILKYTSSVAFVKQHKYALSPNNKYLAIASFTNNQSNLDLVKIEKTTNHTLSLSATKQIDLQEYFTFTYLQLIKFNTDGNKVLLVATRTYKQNQVVVFSIASQRLFSIQFLCPVKMNDTCHYFFLHDYLYGEIITRVSSSGVIEIVKVNNYNERSLKCLQASKMDVTKQILSCNINSFFKNTNLFLGITGEIFVIDIHKEQCIAKISMDDDQFKVSSLFVNWCQSEVFAMRENNSREKSQVKITYLHQRCVLTLEELAAKAVLENYSVHNLRNMNIPTTLTYLTK